MASPLSPQSHLRSLLTLGVPVCCAGGNVRRIFNPGVSAALSCVEGEEGEDISRKAFLESRRVSGFSPFQEKLEQHRGLWTVLGFSGKRKQTEYL